MVILELIHAKTLNFSGRVAIVSLRTNRGNLLMLIITMKQIAEKATFRSSFSPISSRR